jgi:CelD/BcsL family acetyltransferase involved in cellulose biosynthesis
MKHPVNLDIQKNVTIMKAQSPYEINRLATLTQLDALEKDWSELLDEIPGVPIFLTWEWIRTWWLSFGQGRQLWLLTARDNQGRLLGLAPLMREEYKKGWMKFGMIAFIGTGRVCPTHLNILARISDQEGLYRAFLDFLLGHSDQWDVLRIASVDPNSFENNLLTAAGGRIRIGAQITSPYISLPGNWETYLKTVSRKLRKNLKSSSSKLEGDYPGAVDFACITDLGELNSAMEKLTELIRNRCHAKGLPTDWDDPIFTNFQQTIAHLALHRGWLRLYTLTVKDCVIAFIYCFHFKDCVYIYNMGFDIDWSKYSPGRLLIAFSIQTAIRESASQLDFGRGESKYKFDWTDYVRVENEILFSSNWKGNLWIILGNFKTDLIIKAKQIQSRFAKLRMNQFLSERHIKIEDRSV